MPYSGYAASNQAKSGSAAIYPPMRCATGRQIVSTIATKFLQTYADITRNDLSCHDDFLPHRARLKLHLEAGDGRPRAIDQHTTA
jgi:hypothetical protein